MTVTHSRPCSQHTFHVPCEGAAKKQGMDFPGDNRQGEMTSGPAAAYPPRPDAARSVSRTAPAWEAASQLPGGVRSLLCRAAAETHPNSVTQQRKSLSCRHSPSAPGRAEVSRHEDMLGSL